MFIWAVNSKKIYVPLVKDSYINGYGIKFDLGPDQKLQFIVADSKTDLSRETICNMSSKSDDNFKKYYDQYFRQLYGYALEILHDPTLAEDMVQETYLIAWTKFDKLECSPNPGGWLMNTLKYAIRNMLRQTKNLAVPLLPLDEAFFVADKRNIIANELFEIELDNICANNLSETDYLILRKVVFEGYTCVEVATMVGMKINTCQKRFQRIMERLKKSDEIRIFWEK